jgi:(4S)-4-hydroxy-5-phosphonooxypentane-2,3-dione isomerase
MADAPEKADADPLFKQSGGPSARGTRISSQERAAGSWAVQAVRLPQVDTSIAPALRAVLGSAPDQRRKEMYALAVQLQVKPENIEAFMHHVLANAQAAREEPGCRQFDVLVDPNDRTRLMLYEVYADEQAFEQHQMTAHFKKYLAEGVPLLAARERHFWKRVFP